MCEETPYTRFLYVVNALKANDNIYELVDFEHDTGKILAVRARGFAKSDTAIIRFRDDKIIVETRYNQVDEITDYNDLVYIAWQWYKSTKWKGYGSIPYEFIKDFEREGLIKKKTTTQWVET